MNTSTIMERKAIESMTILPKRRDMKIIVIFGACLLLGAGFLMLTGLSSNSKSPFTEQAVHGNDRVDLMRPKAKTGFSLAGTVTINRQFPLGIGYVVAYDTTRSRAIAYSSLDKMGNYKMTDVPPGKLILLVKREITDDPNPVIEETISALGDSSRRAEKSVGLQSTKKPTLAELLGKKRPSKASMSKIKFHRSTPEYECMPEVQWMTDMAFYKFGHFSEYHQLIVEPGEGERVRIIDLTVFE